ncbi:hypothetical protein CKAH01_10331 [Colletotrichum kahawae]|uniref:C2H2-type domain-containing protein n=1 Tax=Colletotrichum kahawae TaxID=34407 RepID=A0AAE0CYX6_COLKA|nr:hypothetical protein CKAH01_10331 [Colletotrichum kahawae]
MSPPPPEKGKAQVSDDEALRGSNASGRNGSPDATETSPEAEDADLDLAVFAFELVSVESQHRQVGQFEAAESPTTKIEEQPRFENIVSHFANSGIVATLQTADASTPSETAVKDEDSSNEESSSSTHDGDLDGNEDPSKRVQQMMVDSVMTSFMDWLDVKLRVKEEDEEDRPSLPLLGAPQPMAEGLKSTLSPQFAAPMPVPTGFAPLKPLTGAFGSGQTSDTDKAAESYTLPEDAIVIHEKQSNVERPEPSKKDGTAKFIETKRAKLGGLRATREGRRNDRDTRKESLIQSLVGTASTTTSNSFSSRDERRRPRSPPRQGDTQSALRSLSLSEDQGNAEDRPNSAMPPMLGAMPMLASPPPPRAPKAKSFSVSNLLERSKKKKKSVEESEEEKGRSGLEKVEDDGEDEDDQEVSSGAPAAFETAIGREDEIGKEHIAYPPMVLDLENEPRRIPPSLGGPSPRAAVPGSQDPMANGAFAEEFEPPEPQRTSKKQKKRAKRASASSNSVVDLQESTRAVVVEEESAAFAPDVGRGSGDLEALLQQVAAAGSSLPPGSQRDRRRISRLSYRGGKSVQEPPGVAAAAPVAASRASEAPGRKKRSLASKRGRSDDKRKEDEEEEDGDGDGNRPPRAKLLKVQEDQVSGAKLACPFFKHNPRKYKNQRPCCGPGWDHVHRIKEHIYRKHSLPKFSCPRCSQPFETQADLQAHARLPTPCEVKEPEVLDGITQDQEKKLRSRKKTSGKELNEAEKWTQVYSLLFPDVREREIPSPYYNTEDAQTNLGGYEDYLRRELPTQVRRQLEKEVEQELSFVEEGMKQKVIEIARNLQLTLFKSYQQIESQERNIEGPSPSIGDMSSPGFGISSFIATDTSPSTMTTAGTTPEMPDPLEIFGGDPAIPDFDFDFLSQVPSTESQGPEKACDPAFGIGPYAAPGQPTLQPGMEMFGGQQFGMPYYDMEGYDERQGTVRDMSVLSYAP